MRSDLRQKICEIAGCQRKSLLKPGRSLASGRSAYSGRCEAHTDEEALKTKKADDTRTDAEKTAAKQVGIEARLHKIRAKKEKRRLRQEKNRKKLEAYSALLIKRLTQNPPPPSFMKKPWTQAAQIWVNHLESLMSPEGRERISEARRAEREAAKLRKEHFERLGLPPLPGKN